MAMPHRKIANAKITDQQGQSNRRGVTPKRHLKNARREHKNFKWSRRWQECGNQHANESILLHPMANCRATLPSLLVEERFPSLARDEIQKHAPKDRTGCGHKCIERHACGMLDGKLYQEKVIDYRKCQHG